jgi:RNA polymerase sigma-70 factor (ECF subfamily)
MLEWGGLREVPMTSKHRAAAEEGFEQRIAPLLDRAAAYAYAIVGNREDAEDALQDAALKGFLAFGRFDPARSFKGWWFVIVRNCCRDLLRRKRTRGSYVPVEPSDLVTGPDAGADRREELQKMFEQLADTHREILELRYFGDCSYREIATVLGIPEGTVMSRLYAARQAVAAVYKRR